MTKGQKVAIIGGIILIPVVLYIAFLLTIASLNSWKSNAFTQLIRELPLPLESEGDIIKRKTLYGNFIGQGNGCTTIEYVIYSSSTESRVMFQTVQSLDFSAVRSTPDTQFFWHLFRKEHGEYVEIDAETITNYGTNPDYWRHEALGILVEDAKMVWPDHAFVFMAITEDQGFWATWDPRCQ
jgi:hypothetical protein